MNRTASLYIVGQEKSVSSTASRAQLAQALAGQADSGGAVFRMEFGEKVLDVLADGFRRDAEDFRDVGIALAVSDPGQDLALTTGESAASEIDEGLDGRA